jgi:hypothetical protein
LGGSGRAARDPASETAVTIETLHLVATLFMTGVIVFVQVVHYPLMRHVGAAEFIGYERQHTLRTGWVVVPPMVVELACSLWIAAMSMGSGEAPVAFTGVALLGVIWVSTGLLQGPAHGRLIRGFDPAVHRRLLLTNWIRTVAWLARIPVAVVLAQ